MPYFVSGQCDSDICAALTVPHIFLHTLNNTGRESKSKKIYLKDDSTSDLADVQKHG